MKTLGIIGGMSAESTVLYYQIINREANRRLGGNSSADIVMHSVNFETVAAMQRAGDWQGAGAMLADSARKLVQAGAQAIVLATNTMHKVAPAIEAAVQVPLIHVVDATAAAVKAAGLHKVALLGTRFTMSDGFYSGRMRALGVETLVPSESHQDEIHRVIFEELCRNRITETAKQSYLRAIESLREAGAQGVIFGCTEIGLLLKAGDCPLPVFDSAEIHALAAADFALG
ncbi:aspartate/glutamate racemase family protein [Neisseria leonii]|uniref:Aspartate/glutamate racemase family protein n=1 Tax=Neisseria leonii TaxID=2995413 RepID=A0A9X4E080_9NEIS|nr:aspartate/glutamate racemase family protein [Neisseria sp. 51.81]MDD9327037.1 aspartate/glutamate racemase family protein [Neisseria sp. 51.81]